MTARYTVERILRDPDDESGQTIRSWHIQAEGQHIMIRRDEDAIGFLLIRASDLDCLREDLDQIALLMERAS